MSLLPSSQSAENMFDALRTFVHSGKPTWGTCAGLILLSDRVEGNTSAKTRTLQCSVTKTTLNTFTKGQQTIGGLDVTVHRNFFGAQSKSFENRMAMPAMLGGEEKAKGGGEAKDGAEEEEQGEPRFQGIFIRAPAILSYGEGVVPLCQLTRPPANSTDGKAVTVSVAVRQGSLLATAFHPELTEDKRWHEYFLSMIAKDAASADASASSASS